LKGFSIFDFLFNSNIVFLKSRIVSALEPMTSLVASATSFDEVDAAEMANFSLIFSPSISPLCFLLAAIRAASE
jgi:hypothetical protein